MEGNGAFHDREEGSGFLHSDGIRSPPLQRPTIRVQDGDIILEDAAPVEHGVHLDTPNGYDLSLEAPGPAFDITTPPPPPPPHAKLNVVHTVHTSALANNTVVPHHNSQSPKVLNSGDSTVRSARNHRLKLEPKLEKMAFEQNTVMRNDNFKLTLSNVQQYTDLIRDEGRASTAERIRIWLQDAGPPYDVQPSVGVPTKGSHNFVSGFTNRNGPPKRDGHFRWLSCFRCIS